MAAADVIVSNPLLGTNQNDATTLKTDNSTVPLLDLSNIPSKSEYVTFDPKKHLHFTPPEKTHTMKELGYDAEHGISPVGVSEPFQLFSPQAIRLMRGEVLRDEVWREYKYSSNISDCQLRGFAAKYGSFVYDAWKNPETLALISKVAGVDLVTAMDWEIGHTNISLKSEETTKQELATLSQNVDDEDDDDDAIVRWHTDSYPFVCVLMLSDCTNMKGGETALKTGDGSVTKVRGPKAGCAVVLQGRYIEHKALRALGATERITMVTSFRPRSVQLPDDTVLTTVRAVSDLSELYFQFSQYRLEMLEDRIRDELRRMRERRAANRRFDSHDMKTFLATQKKFLEHMDREIVYEDQVIKGYTDDSHLVSAELKERSRKRYRHN